METEAYLGPTDAASHARHGRASRAAPMFGEPGYAYIYFTYGMYYCLNCVTEPAGSGTGILLRALEPVEGVERMRANRAAFKAGPSPKARPLTEHQLTNGPGKLCLALNLTQVQNGADLTGEELWIEDASLLPPARIATSPRVGITHGREHPYRFYDSQSRFVSAHPKY